MARVVEPLAEGKVELAEPLDPSRPPPHPPPGPAQGNGLGMNKRLHVITWGCQMNVYDSGRMADVLAPLGYAPTAAGSGAGMVILNTCHIREKAEEKVFSELGRLRVIKQARE